MSSYVNHNDDNNCAGHISSYNNKEHGIIEANYDNEHKINKANKYNVHKTIENDNNNNDDDQDIHDDYDNNNNCTPSTYSHLRLDWSASDVGIKILHLNENTYNNNQVCHVKINNSTKVNDDIQLSQAIVNRTFVIMYNQLRICSTHQYH